MLCAAVLHHLCLWCSHRQLSERLYLPAAQGGIPVAEQLPLHDLRHAHPETGSDPDFQLVPAQGKMPQLRRKDPVPLYAGGESERRAVRADLRILRHL